MSTGVEAAGSEDGDAGDGTRNDTESNPAPEASQQADAPLVASCESNGACLDEIHNSDGETNLKHEDVAADLPVRLASALDAALASGELVKTVASMTSTEKAADNVQPSEEEAEIKETPGICEVPSGQDTEAAEALGTAAENTASDTAPGEPAAASTKAAEAVQPSDEPAEVAQPSSHDAEAAEVSGTATEDTATDNVPGEPPVATTKAEGIDAPDRSPTEAPAADSASSGIEAAGAEAPAQANSMQLPGEAAADAEAIGTEAACAEAPAESTGEGAPGEEAAPSVAAVDNEQI